MMVVKSLLGMFCPPLLWVSTSTILVLENDEIRHAVSEAQQKNPKKVTKPSNIMKITTRKYTIQTMTNNHNNNKKTNPRLTFQPRRSSQINHHLPQQHLSLQELRQNSQQHKNPETLKLQHCCTLHHIQ